MIANLPYFTPFTRTIPAEEIPASFTLFERGTPHELCLLAIRDLQHYLDTQQEWKHNFGLSDKGDGSVIGKMFGVLVIQTADHQTGYLSAFSGKLAGTNQHPKFVPPIYDLLQENGFLSPGMLALTAITETIKQLEASPSLGAIEEIKRLKAQRKKQSVKLQKQIFEQYHFLNKAGISKGIFELFTLPDYKNPPAGAGECAGPKLLQYAFEHNMRPLALAEFWWGQSPKSTQWKHGHYYACCKEKCAPILAHMLEGIDG